MEFIVYLFIALMGGMLTVIAPCSLPILPGYAAHLTNARRGQLLRNTLFLSLGMSLVFVLLGAFAGSIGGFLLVHKRTILMIMGFLLIIYGVFVGLSLFKPKHFSAKSSFAFGSLLGITWTGCIGPILGVILVLAAGTGSQIQGAVLLFVYGIGLLLPFFGISYWLDALPKTHSIWKILLGRVFTVRLFHRQLYLHTTHVAAGVFFILLGALFLLELQFRVSMFIAPSFTEWTFSVQEWLLTR